MDCRHEIDNEYNSDPRHIKQWDMTIEWLHSFDTDTHYKIYGMCLDCGNPSEMTNKIVREFCVGVVNTKHDLDYLYVRSESGLYDNIFIFEIIEHLLNPLLFMEWVNVNLDIDGTVYLSTPINRPNWIRNRVRHFHEFNYNELMHLIDVAGFWVVDEKIINPSVKWWTGFRPVMRKFFGCGNNILLRLKRKE